jgi:cold shock protein
MLRRRLARANRRKTAAWAAAGPVLVDSALQRCGAAISGLKTGTRPRRSLIYRVDQFALLRSASRKRGLSKFAAQSPLHEALVPRDFYLSACWRFYNVSQGTIKKLTDKGFGFIQGENGDIFFHSSSVEGAGFDSLYEGQSVSYNEGMGPKGKRAENVQPVA